MRNLKYMSLIAEIKELLPAVGSRLRPEELMALHTSFRIGGPADIFFEAEAVDEVILLIEYCRNKGLPYTILGRGSNVLVADRGIRGVVISIADHFAGIALEEKNNDDDKRKLFTVKAGTGLTYLSRYMAKLSLSGLEFACGIPGTLGGAIMMNAGAYDGCMEQVISRTVYLNEDLAICSISGSEHRFSYRDSIFAHNNFIILQADLVMVNGDKTEILARMAELNRRRQASQPLELASAGSAFKRPAGFYAGRLICDSGLQGARIGDAQVSEKHAGFIVNLGAATAGDVYSLFHLVREKVYRRTGVEMIPEVRFIGEW